MMRWSSARREGRLVLSSRCQSNHVHLWPDSGGWHVGLGKKTSLYFVSLFGGPLVAQC